MKTQISKQHTVRSRISTQTKFHEEDRMKSRTSPPETGHLLRNGCHHDIVGVCTGRLGLHVAVIRCGWRRRRTSRDHE